jgi:hypothetical protein
MTRMSDADPYADPGLPQDPTAPAGRPSRTAVLERELVEEQHAEPGDHERFAHYVRKEKILESALSGDPVVALCGKVWVPGRDPNRVPVCPVCKEIYQNLAAGGDDPDA